MSRETATDSALRVAQAAEFLLAARRGAPKQGAFPAPIAPQSEAEAWAVQDLLCAHLGTHPGGWKVSLASETQGYAAPLMARDILMSPANLAEARTLSTTQFGIEPEVCFLMGKDLQPLSAGAHYSREAVMDAIATAHTGIELCVCRFQDFNAAPLLDRLADNLMNEGLVVGPACSDWRGLDLVELPLCTLIDGETVHEAQGGFPLKDPLIPLVWLANHLSQRRITLRAGSYVTTGSYNGLRLVPIGGSCEVRFTGLGNARVTF